MESISELVSVDRGTGSMTCYHARPTSPGSYPALIVAMEAWGLNEQIKRIADRLAGEGFAAIVPDLYFRQTDHVADYNDLAKGFRLMATLKDDEFVADMDAALQYLKSREGVSRNFGTVGFCLGGTVAFLTACRNPEVKAAVLFYGAGMLATTPGSGGNPRSERVSGLQAQVLGFFGGLDAFIPVTKIEKLRQVLSAERKQAEIVVYSDADHGFMNEDRPSYHSIRAQEAWQRTISFFKSRLG